jgi:hypothetical protein
MSFCLKRPPENTCEIRPMPEHSGDKKKILKDARGFLLWRKGFRMACNQHNSFVSLKVRPGLRDWGSRMSNQAADQIWVRTNLRLHAHKHFTRHKKKKGGDGSPKLGRNPKESVYRVPMQVSQRDLSGPQHRSGSAGWRAASVHGDRRVQEGCLQERGSHQQMHLHRQQGEPLVAQSLGENSNRTLNKGKTWQLFIPSKTKSCTK